MEMLSPGVYIEERDASQIVPTTSTNVAVFAGNFYKGTAGDFNRLNSVSDLISIFGYPNNSNYNDWYQCYNFLQYGNNLLVSRALNVNGQETYIENADVVSWPYNEIVQEEVAAQTAECEIATAVNEGAQGNNITIEITQGEPEVTQEEVKASCKYAEAIRAGESGNSYKIIVEGSSGNWNIILNNGEEDIFKKESYTKDTIEPSDLSNPYVTFKAQTLSAEEVQLEGGKNKIEIPRFNALTKVSGVLKDTVTNKKTSDELIDNAWVKWKDGIQLAINTYQLQGGVDYVEEIVEEKKEKIELQSVKDFNVNDVVKFGESRRYLIKSIDAIKKILELDREITDEVSAGNEVFKVEISFNGSVEAVDETETTETPVLGANGESTTINVPNDVLDRYDLFDSNIQIINYPKFEELRDSIPFAKPASSKIKFLSRNPGSWCDDLRICIAKPESFEANSNGINFVPHYAFEGIVVDDLFEYAPKDNQIGVIVYDNKNKQVLEIYTVSFDETAKDYNKKSIFIENVINRNSSYIYCKINTTNVNDVADYTLVYDTLEEKYVGKTLKLYNSSDSDIQKDDLLDAYDVFSNTEDLDIDIVIANELDNGVSAKNLVETRQDCIAFIGCNYDDVVSKKTTDAVNNLVNWRKNVINFNNMFCVACGNYKQQYDRYRDKDIWVNIAGDIAGLRAQTNTNQASWWASAGLERGQLKNVTKLAFNPTQAQRDTLYKNAINPIVTFPGQGTVCWGQKTLLDEASSFDRVNVRGLFNYLERALKKMSKYQVMEFNDAFTRNKIVSMIKPFLSSVKAGRGVQDYMVICDESNNTADVISRNQLIVDVYIKPTYVAEFILLRFTNAGVNDFSEVIQGA